VSAIVQVIGGTTGLTAISFFVMWLTGLIHTKAELDDKTKQIDEYKQALKEERARNDNLQATGMIVRDVLTGLREELKKLCTGHGGIRWGGQKD
jgi:hypothetical protein